MVSGRHKSRSLKRKKVRTKTKTKTRYDPKTPSKATCPETGQVLKGVPSKSKNNMKKVGNSQRSPERPFGGKLSSQAMRKKIKQRAREMNK